MKCMNYCAVLVLSTGNFIIDSKTRLYLVTLFNPFRAGAVFRRQNLTSKVLTSNEDPRTDRITKCILAVDP